MSDSLEWLSKMEEPELPETPAPPEAPPIDEDTPPAVPPPPSAEPPAAVPPSVSEQTLRDLQTLLREQSRKIAQLETKLSTAPVPKPAAPKDEWDVSDGEPPAAPAEPPKPSIIESLHQNLAAVAEERGSIFELQLEMMGELPAYKDVADVCSQANFDFIISNAARRYSADKSIPLEQAMLEIENTIWTKPNPYKYMYKVIKEVHPKYKETAPPAAPPAEPPKPPAEPPKVPDSIADAGGSGGTGTTGWTAAKVDALSEEDLSKVPRDVYEKWLAGELK
jgi:hypothetical protein